MPVANKEKMYNEQIKERFLKESGWGKSFVSHTRVIFKRTSHLENSLQKDIYQFNAQDTSDLLHFLQIKTTGQVMQFVSTFAKYQTWAYEENLTDNPVNYFSTLYNSNNASEFISDVAKETWQISEEQLRNYEKMLTDIGSYVDAALLRGCYLGLRGTKLSELLELTIDRVKPDKIVLDNRTVPITDYEYHLFLSAHEQPEMISLKGENRSNARPYFLKIPYIFKKVNRPEKLAYHSLAAKILAIGEYVGHLGLTTTNLYFSGIANSLIKIMENDGVDIDTVFQERSLDYFIKLKEKFGFQGEPHYLKYKLKDYFDIR